VPLAWLVIVCFTAGWQKIFAAEPALGFLAQADLLARGPQSAAVAAQIFNNRLDAAVTGIFLVLVATVVIDSVRVWASVLQGTRTSKSTETPFIPTTLAEEV